jgi:hypothetical protein
MRCTLDAVRWVPYTLDDAPYTGLHDAAQHYARQAKQCHANRNAMRYNAMRYNAMRYNAMLIALAQVDTFQAAGKKLALRLAGCTVCCPRPALRYVR